MRVRQQRPADYDPDAFPRVAVTVDVVVLTLVEHELRVLLIERGEEPYAGWWALPGGFIRPDETLDQAASRELQEETGVRAAAHLEQFGAYGEPDRDPRMRIVSIGYLAIMRDVGAIKASTDARNVELVAISDLLARRPKRKLAFDHHQILTDAVDHARAKLENTSIATAFVGPEFTMSDLRGVYEAAWEMELDPGNFRRKVLQIPRFRRGNWSARIRRPDGGKPAETYRARQIAPLEAPLRPPRQDRPKH